MSSEFKIFKETLPEDAVTTCNIVNGKLKSPGTYLSAHRQSDGSISGSKLYMSINPINLGYHNIRIKQAILRFMTDSINNPKLKPYKLCVHRAYGDINVGESAPGYDENILEYEVLPATKTGRYQFNFDISELVDEAIKNDSRTNLVIRAIGDDDSELDIHILNSTNTLVPELTVEYETNYNFYSHHSTSHSLGRFGQGKIDLNCGKLEFLSQDFAWGGNRMPVTIKHQYNSALSNYQYTNDFNANLYTGDFYNVKLGLGWKLNLMQCMRDVYKYDTASYDYVFLDENGNETYLKEGDQITSCTDICDRPYHLYEDENGNGITYNHISETLTMDSLKYHFDHGRLIEIANEHSSIHINYSNGQIISVTDGVGRDFVFTYNDLGFLERITAPDNLAKIEYGYTGELLTAITYPDGTITTISYLGTDNKPSTVTLHDSEGNAIYKVKYDFTGDKVTGVTEYNIENGEFVISATASYSYDYMANKTEVTTIIPKDEEDSETSDTVLTSVYSFDKFGSLVGQYTYGADGEKGEMSVTTGINPLPSMSMAASNVDNLLINHNFNDGLAGWTEGPQNCSNVETVAIFSDEYAAEYGRNILALQADICVNETTVYQDTVTLPAGDYTFSAYTFAHYYNPCDYGNIHLSVTTTSGEILTTSEYITFSSYDKIRLIAPFTLDVAQSVRVYFHASGQGTVYFSAPQLENNNCANNYNMLVNSNFEHGITGWYVPGDAGLSNTEKFNMNNSLYLNGDLCNKNTVIQTVDVKTDKTTRETFTLSGWAKAYGLPSREREGCELPQFNISAIIKYSNGTTETHTANFSSYTDAWQPAQITFAKEQYLAVEDITVSCNYDYNNGRAYFDDIRLFRTNIETNLTASDFEDKNSNNSNKTKEFEEVKDQYGNTLTSTNYVEGEYGTIYLSYDYIGNNPSVATAGNDLIEKTDARGLKTIYDVDTATSRVKTVTDRCGNKTEYKYDHDGRKEKVISQKSDGTEVSYIKYSYDNFNNLNKIARCDGMEYSLGYNHHHKLENIGIDGMLQPLISYNYKKGSGRLKEISYANGYKIKAVYNSAGKPMSETIYNDDIEVNTYRYLYDNSGKLVRSIDTKNSLSYNYTYSDNKIIRTNIFRVSDNKKTAISFIEYSYFGDNLIHSKRIYDGENTVAYTYEYPKKAEPIVKITLNGKTIKSQYKTDSFGRKLFDEIQTGRGFISRQFSYYAGQVTEEHKANGKLKSAPITNLVSHIALSDGRTLSYEYDGEERITKITDSIEGTTEYIYDSKGQLTDEIRNGVTINHMVYDKHGNILQKNSNIYTYDSIWKDKLLSCCSDESFRYDTQGNPEIYFNNKLTWTNGRQLESWNNIKYEYNMHGVRTSKIVENVIHSYIVDGTNILKETWNGNTLIPIYDNSNNVCGINYNGKTYYFLKNLQNDVIAIMNDEGETVACYQYDAWGCCTVTTVPENTVDNIAYVNPFRYRCYYYDTETNLYYLQSRYYDPNTGRFINADLPDFVALTGGNLYAYCNNSPIRFVDYYGFCSDLNDPNYNGYYNSNYYNEYQGGSYEIEYYKQQYENSPLQDFGFADSLATLWDIVFSATAAFGLFIAGLLYEIYIFIRDNPRLYAIIKLIILIICVIIGGNAAIVISGILLVIDLIVFLLDTEWSTADAASIITGFFGVYGKQSTLFSFISTLISLVSLE